MKAKNFNASLPSHEQHSAETSSDKESYNMKYNQESINELERAVNPLNTEIEYAKRIIWHGPIWPSSDHYEIKLSGFDMPVPMSISTFQQDSELLKAFQDIPGVEILSRQTVKQTAALLRRVITQHAEVRIISSHAGWKPTPLDEDYPYKFWLFDNRSTHIVWGITPAGTFAIKPAPSSTMLPAIQRFHQEFQIDQTVPEGWLLNTAFHLASLTSLLQELGHSSPLSFCFLTENPESQVWITSWFSWFDDLPISLESDPEEFAAALLDSVLTSQQIPWMDGQQEDFTPLQWLPVILSTDASDHTERPNCLTVELPAGLEPDVPEVTAEAAKRDYLVSFIQYTTGHVDDLRRSLNNGLKRACQRQPEIVVFRRNKM